MVNSLRFLRPFFSLMIFASPAILQAQVILHSPEIPKYTNIIGTVVDSTTNLPVELATVALIKDKGDVVASTVSLEDGSFKIQAEGTGSFIIKISTVGYKAFSSSIIHVLGDTSINVGRIVLLPEAGTLGNVVVKSKPPLVQSKGDKLIYNASADISNKAGSASDVLRKAPMVSVGADGEVKMRGSSNIKVLLNGVPSGVLAKNLKEALKMIPASSIAYVEVITSPSAKYEAEGAAGVINIVTKNKMRGTSGNLDLAAGNLEQSANLGLNMATGKFNFNLTLNGSTERQRNVSDLRRVFGQPVAELNQKEDALQKNKGAYGDFTTEYRPDSSQKIGLTISFWQGQWPVRSSLYNSYKHDQQTTAYKQTSDQTGKFTMGDFLLNYNKKFKRAGQELQLISQYTRFGDRSGYLTNQYHLSGQHYFTEQSPNKGRSGDLSVQADYGHPLSVSGKQLIETGVRYSRNNAINSFRVFNNRNIPGSSLIEDSLRSNRMDYSQDILAAYFSIQLQSKNKWVFRPGIRFERTSLKGEFQKNTPSFKAAFVNWVPGILVSKKLNDQHTIKLNYTQRIRRPWQWDLNPYVDASDPRNLTSGNPQLRPEVTRTIEAGHDYSDMFGMTLNSSIYFATNSNAIESFTTVDSLGISRTIPRNVASNKRLGANVNAYLMLNGNWTLSTGLEYYRVWFKSKALNVSNSANYYSININSSYTLSANYTVQLSADYSNGYVTLQGRNSASYSYQFALRKELFNKKAGLTLNISNPFQKTFLQRNSASAPTFQSVTTNRYYNRAFTLSFSWQFGGLRSSGSTEKRFTIGRIREAF